MTVILLKNIESKSSSDFKLRIDSYILLKFVLKVAISSKIAAVIYCLKIEHKNLIFLWLGKEVIKKIEHQPCNEKSRPYNPCTISNCGELVLVKKVKKLTADDLTSSSGMFSFSKITRFLERILI